MAAEPAILCVQGLARSFGGIQAVDECTFDVQPGLITGLIGPNGAGKTTVFNLITGFLSANHGSIRLQGKEILGLSPHRVERLGDGKRGIDRKSTRLNSSHLCISDAV